MPDDREPTATNTAQPDLYHLAVPTTSATEALEITDAAEMSKIIDAKAPIAITKKIARVSLQSWLVYTIVLVFTLGVLLYFLQPKSPAFAPYALLAGARLVTHADFGRAQLPALAPGERLKVLVVYGTRPEAVKLAPVIQELKRRKQEFDTRVCVTGQHRQMLDQINDYFGIVPDIDLNVMQPDQTLPGLSAAVLTEVTDVIVKNAPHVVVVQGDTTTAMIAALAAFYQKVAVAHVEAGLRTNNIYNPFPEEMNRQMIGRLASFHFAATATAQQALLMENVAPSNIFLTGNPVIDATQWAGRQSPSERTSKLLEDLGVHSPDASRKQFILLTAHRRENFGDPLQAICQATLDLVSRNKDVVIIFPVHLNPNVRAVVYPLLANHTQIKLIDPLDYEDLIHLMKHSYAIMTDSGGIQEEATAFGKPIVVLRSTTEREEGVRAGAARLVGVNRENIVEAVQALLSDHRVYNSMSSPRAVYGDGLASRRIADALAGHPVDQFRAMY